MLFCATFLAEESSTARLRLDHQQEARQSGADAKEPPPASAFESSHDLESHWDQRGAAGQGTSGDATTGSHDSARPSRQRGRSPVPLFRKKVTNATTLRSMHITLDMVAALDLGELEAPVELSSQARAIPRHTVTLFRHFLVLRDPEANVWPVVYEATQSARQVHRRLSKGWQDFCRYHGIQIGDTLEFRKCQPSEPVTMRVRVVRWRKDGV